MIVRRFLILAALALASTPAAAADIVRDGNEILVSGEIAKGDDVRFADIANNGAVFKRRRADVSTISGNPRSR